MMHRYVYESLDRTLQDVLGVKKPFGGVPILLGGDWRQTLPVVKRATKAAQFASTLKASPLWPHFQILKLTKNMRVAGFDDESNLYREFLLRVGIYIIIFFFFINNITYLYYNITTQSRN
jgi:hypothetical protein